MKASRMLVVLVFTIFVCWPFSYAQDTNKAVDKGTATEKAKEEKLARQVQDRDDALQIAKNYLQEQNLQADYHLVGHMTKPLVKLEDGVWNVVFLKKKNKEADKTVDTESIRIKIEDSTARVIEHEEQVGFFINRAFR
jgi:hypothetical protein